MAKKKLKNKGKQVNKPAVIDNFSSEVIAAAYSAATQPAMPIFLKVCRLCESKDGPFLNIFDADKVTAKKIDELMPFSVTENDDLPHKICFRCSAKLEELFEFIQKCIKTQENLRSAIGKSDSFITKSKMGKKLWEEKLNKSNMSNDDICDALIKKAMEGIKNIPPNTTPVEDESPQEMKRVTRSRETLNTKKDVKSEPKSDDTDDVNLTQVKMSIDVKPTTNKTTRSGKSDAIQTKKPEPTQQTNVDLTPPKKLESKKQQQSKKQVTEPTASENETKINEQKNNSISNFSLDYDTPATSTIKETTSEEEKKEEPKKPFNIMDYISMIKVNGVGILFQCKLCNRNFLRKDVVESHNCARNGVPKVDAPKSVPAPEPPKVPTVKYIKIDGDMKKSLTGKIKKAEQSENEKRQSAESSLVEQKSLETQPPPKPKPKPKAGPASKTRRHLIESDSCSPQGSSETPNTDTVNPPGPPSVHFSNMPNLNGRFKLVPGPNNIFTLVEDTPNLPATNSGDPVVEPKKSSRKRKSDDVVEVKTKDRKIVPEAKSPEIIDLEDQSKPYPVGLFQTVPHSARLFDSPAADVSPSFTTPAMKKQSYTIVQTGNPSKLLISTKAKAVEVEAPKKRPKKSKPEVIEDSSNKEPYTVTLEDVTPPKDPGFFTFINVDPLLQPSYVLPTDNIIQESQISTSSAVLKNTTESKESKDKEKYSCNMCNERFSREKKLLAHIQSHYTKMDEEDQIRAEKTAKKKGKK